MLPVARRTRTLIRDAEALATGDPNVREMDNKTCARLVSKVGAYGEEWGGGGEEEESGF